MACCNIWGNTRLNFETSSIQHFFIRFVSYIYSDIDIENFADNNTPYLFTKNVEDSDCENF